MTKKTAQKIHGYDVLRTHGGYEVFLNGQHLAGTKTLALAKEWIREQVAKQESATNEHKEAVGLTQDNLKEYLRNNLRMSYEVSGGLYGTHVFKEIKLLLEGEEISSIYIDD